MTLIRPIEEADFPDVLTMIHALAAHHGDPVAVTLDDLRRDASGAHPWVSILVAPQLGYVALCPLAQLQFGVRGMDMHHLFVMERARARGVGRDLIAAAVAYAKMQGCRYITVGTHPENPRAGEVYRAAGFDDLPPPGPRFRMKW